MKPSSPAPHLRDEMARQLALVDREKAIRLSLTVVAYAIATIFVPVWVAVLAALTNLTAEVVSMRLMRNLDPARDRTGHRVTIFCVFLMELSFCTVAGLIWISDAPHAQPLALGLVMTTIIQVTTVRSIHLPHALAGLAGIALPVLGFNTAHFLALGNPIGLAVSTLCALGGLAYSLSATMANHRIHEAMAADRAIARSADEAKSRFIAQVSHELRTPLNAIIGMGLTERARTSDPAAIERLDVLVDAARGLGVIVDDILDLSALREGRLSVRPVPADPLAVAAATVELFRPSSAAAGMSIALLPRKALPAAVMIDAQRLRQCLSNLLSNAIKHGGQGAIDLRLDWQDGVLEIEVGDTGPGVAPEWRENVFEPFNRGSGSRPGSGLGLSISRALAQGMGGSLELLPEGPGARFCLRLPAPATEAALPDPGQPPAKDALQGRCFLVVDDIATNRLVASAFLATLGATSVEADNGTAALERMEETRFDGVLLDMNMPGLSGIDTFLAMRARFGRAFPVVAMTADATEDHRRRYLEAGLDGHLPKPISPDSLLQALAPLLQPRKAAPGAQSAG